jgi:antirestriction protein
LTKHKATHTGEKLHECYICGAKFGRNFYVKVS